MKNQELVPLYDQQQVCHRRRRNQSGALKQWTEKSVWSFVCAMELGLVSDPVSSRDNVDVSSTNCPSTVRSVNNSHMVTAVASTTSTRRNTQNRQIAKTPARRRQVSKAQSSKTQTQARVKAGDEELRQVSSSQQTEMQFDYFQPPWMDHNFELEKEINNGVTLEIEEYMASEVGEDTTSEVQEDMTSEAQDVTSEAQDVTSEAQGDETSDVQEYMTSRVTPFTVKKRKNRPEHNHAEEETISTSQSDYVPESSNLSASQSSSELPMPQMRIGRLRRCEAALKTDSDYEYESPKRTKRIPMKQKKKVWRKPKAKNEIDKTTDVSTTNISCKSSENNRIRKKKKLKAAAKKKEGGTSDEENEEFHKRRLELRRSLERAREIQNDSARKRHRPYDVALTEQVNKYEAIRAKLLGKQLDVESSEPKVKTRGSLKKEESAITGSLVWGNCSGWWPALIVDAEHVGMLPEAGKLWVYWIAEARISLLNEKTQIEPFSRHLKSRLSQNSNAARLRAIDTTMQMVRARLGCRLTKPYYTWLETQLDGMFELLEELRFYPYPTQMQERISQLRRKNSKAVEKFLEEKKRTEENQGRKSKENEKRESSQTQVQKEDDVTDSVRLPLREQNPGVIAWAKIYGHKWWPAMIVDYRDCCMREPTFGSQWIIWYGDYQLSEVNHQHFLRFDKAMESMRECTYGTKGRKLTNFADGVLQAAKDFGDRLGLNTEEWTLEDAFKLIPTAEQNKPQPDWKPPTTYVKIYDKYTPHIAQKLNEARKDPKINFARANEITNSEDLKSVVSGKVPFESLCLKCLKIADGEKESHPFFEGSLCKECVVDFKPFMFVFGNDGKCFYCTVCSATGTVLICDRDDCPRVYCAACVKHLLCPKTYREVLREDPWYCYLCKLEAETPLDPSSLLKPRLDWREKIIDVFRTHSNSCRLEPDGKERRKIRVLSLFDGLSTGMLVLQKLGLVVDAYYASEIDPDAIMIGTANFGNRIQHLGDVRKITKEKLEEIAPIDLLIGGSPCNDLSLVNPARRGLNDPKGTGILFFEYLRILKLMKKINKKRELFWLFENVASMPTKFRLEINKHLRQEPDTIDSADFSPQHRLRLYWHNLPVKPHMLIFQPPQDVQDILTPNCQRYSLVKKIRTVTTRVNSLRQGVLHLKPIMMQDKCDTIWITELEEIFGFPRHYTDVMNLSATKRQKLLGKSWSVQTLTAILGSLCPFFECNITNVNPTKLSPKFRLELTKEGSPS